MYMINIRWSWWSWWSHDDLDELRPKDLVSPSGAGVYGYGGIATGGENPDLWPKQVYPVVTVLKHIKTIKSTTFVDVAMQKGVGCWLARFPSTARIIHLNSSKFI